MIDVVERTASDHRAAAGPEQECREQQPPYPGKQGRERHRRQVQDAAKLAMLQLGGKRLFVDTSQRGWPASVL